MSIILFYYSACKNISGAKRTWRKDSQILFQQTAFGTFSTHAATSTSISAKHSDPKVSFSAQHMPQPVVVQPKSSMVRFTAGGPVTQAIPSASKAFGNDAVEVDVSISGIGSYSIAEDGAKIFCTGN